MLSLWFTQIIEQMDFELFNSFNYSVVYKKTIFFCFHVTCIFIIHTVDHSYLGLNCFLAFCSHLNLDCFPASTFIQTIFHPSIRIQTEFLVFSRISSITFLCINDQLRIRLIFQYFIMFCSQFGIRIHLQHFIFSFILTHRLIIFFISYNEIHLYLDSILQQL